MLGALYLNLGGLKEAQAVFERSIELARAQGSLCHQSMLAAFRGLIRFHCGPRDEAQDMYVDSETRAKLSCPSCGRELVPSLARCPHCGSLL